MTIDERISRLENLTPSTVKGTTITRILDKVGLKWSLGLGAMHEPKLFYVGETIEEILTLAENELL